MTAGCAKVYREKASGAKTDRPELRKTISRLEPGDVLMVTRLDRLARSTRDLLNVIEDVSKRGAGFRSLKDAWADTTSPHGRLMLTVLGGLAEFERELIRARTPVGIRLITRRGTLDDPLPLGRGDRNHLKVRSCLIDGEVVWPAQPPLSSSRTEQSRRG